MEKNQTFNIKSNSQGDTYLSDPQTGINTKSEKYISKSDPNTIRIDDIRISHSKFIRLNSDYIDFLINFVSLYPTVSKTYFMLVNEVSNTDRSEYIFRFAEKTKKVWADILQITDETLRSHLKTLNELNLVNLTYDEQKINIVNVSINTKVFHNGKNKINVNYEMNLNKRKLISFYNKGRAKKNKKQLLPLRTEVGRNKIRFYSINIYLFRHLIDFSNLNHKSLLLFLYMIRESSSLGDFDFSLNKAKDELRFSKKSYQEAMNLLDKLKFIKNGNRCDYKLNTLLVWSVCIKTISAEYAENVSDLKKILDYSPEVLNNYKNQKNITSMSIIDEFLIEQFESLLGEDFVFINRRKKLDKNGSLRSRKYRQKDTLEEKGLKQPLKDDMPFLDSKTSKHKGKDEKRLENRIQKTIKKPSSLKICKDNELDRDLKSIKALQEQRRLDMHSRNKKGQSYNFLS